jgi:hypothetical protein
MIKSGLAWNKGRKVGQKRALRPQDVWMIRGRLRTEGRKRDLALFNLAIDSKPSACDLSPCKSKMSATIACIGVLRTPKELRSGVAERPKAGAQPGQGGFTANSQQADLGHRLSTSRVGVFRFRADPVILIRPDPPFD